MIAEARYVLVSVEEEEVDQHRRARGPREKSRSPKRQAGDFPGGSKREHGPTPSRPPPRHRLTDGRCKAVLCLSGTLWHGQGGCVVVVERKITGKGAWKYHDAVSESVRGRAAAAAKRRAKVATHRWSVVVPQTEVMRNEAYIQQLQVHGGRSTGQGGRE